MLPTIEEEKRACIDCGNIEAMSPWTKRCHECRLKRAAECDRKAHVTYYQRNRARLLAYSKERQQRIKEQRKAEEAEYKKALGDMSLSCHDKPKNDTGRQKEVEKRGKWTVEFIKTEDGYTWRAWFRNPDTDRLVKFESAFYFDNIEAAQKDYMQATI